MLPHRRLSSFCRSRAAAAVLAGAAQKGHSRLNLGGSRAIRGRPPHWSIARDLLRALPGASRAPRWPLFLVAVPIELVARRRRRAQDLAGLTASGSYLAARHAGQQRDAGAAAAYYRAALKRDPNNAELLDRTFLSLLVDGDIDEAVQFAERVRADRQERPRRAARARRARAQAQAISGGAPRPRAVGARTDHRPDRDAADRLGHVRRRRHQGRGRRDRQAGRARTGTRSSRICMPA